MRDTRINELADLLVNYSIDLQKGDKVWIDMSCHDDAMVTALVEQVYAGGGIPVVTLTDPRAQRKLLLGLTEETAKLMAQFDQPKMQAMDCYIGVRAQENIFEQVDVPEEKIQMYDTLYYKPVHMETRLSQTKWVVLRYPNESMAQLAQMSTEAFEDYYFSVCNVDYKKMSKAMDPLVKLMEQTDKVRIVSPGTDVSFSIKDIPVVKCDGERNIPDGEVYTAPVRDSVNGKITYNTPSMEQGFKYENICFEIKDGKIINATSNDNERINNFLDADEGARYFGEFAIGVNPNVTSPMLDTLFDEKISGSIHFTPGNAYDTADNGNRSANHWDLVLIQRAEYGGGEMYFDDKLVRKDGLFVLPELEGLNPENLK